MATLTEYGDITNEEITLYRNIYMLMTIHKKIYTNNFIANSFRIKDNTRKYMYKNQYYMVYMSYVDQIDEAYDRYHECKVLGCNDDRYQILENLKNEIKPHFINLMMAIPVNMLKEINMQFSEDAD